MNGGKVLLGKMKDKSMSIEELAILYDEEWSLKVRQLGKEMGINQEFVKCFSEMGIVVVVEPGISELVYNRKCPTTLKPGNIFVDLKKLSEAIAQIFSGIQMPESLFDIGQMILLIILGIKDIVNVKLPVETVEILITLMQNGGFESWMEEEELYHKVNDYNKRYDLLPVEREKILEVSTLLDKYGVVEIQDGKILLKEKVFGKDFF